VGCAAGPDKNYNSQKHKQDYHRFALSHVKQSELARDQNQKDQHLITAADYFIQSAAYTQANQILKGLDKSELSDVQIEHITILQAEIALAEQNLTETESLLNHIWTPSKLPTKLQIKFYRTRANTLLRSGSIFDAVQDRITLSHLLKDNEEIQENNFAIWDDLMQLTPNSLHELSDSTNSSLLNGWLKLAYINKQYDFSAEQKHRALTLWQREYHNHPAGQFMDNLSDHGNTSFYNKHEESTSSKVGLLLPLAGVHAKSAKAVKDGFIAAFYQDNSQYRRQAYEIKIYDTSPPSNPVDAYKKAKDEGIGFIVGPLTKQEVDSIASINLSMPVLALNTVNLKNTPKNLYQFGLPPDPQARTIALKARQNDYKNAAAIIPNTPWGNRILQAFIREWKAQGGNIVTTIIISGNKDLDSTVQELLHINKSKARHTALKNIGIKAQFTPHRRSDLDFIFLATDSTTAKQIKPLLNFYFAGNIPIYASSNVYSANNNSYDTDLDGVFFCDIPWVLDPAIKLRSNYKTIAKLGSDNFEDYSRLYALGLDAYKVMKEFDQLHDLSGFVISGMTGMLSLTKDNTIEQKLIWAKIKGGKAILENWNDKTKGTDQ
jgi:outer membrane PBP1 activator LpoA protein